MGMKKKSHYHDQFVAARRQAREAQLAALREGRKVRATTFSNRKKEASRRACRGRVGIS
tara:strand:- start:305 stop:481 length:177 start_codon:yes stop_codon:yes gene_type:complete